MRYKPTTAARDVATVPKSSLKFIPSGSVGLDLVLGGGWPLGRMVNIVGDKSTGKTLLAIEACANFVRTYPEGKIWYREAEAAFDKLYAKALGMPIKKISFVEDEPDDFAFRTVEDFFADLAKACEYTRVHGVPGLYIIDSLDALSSEAELARDIDDKSFGGEKAKKLHELFRRSVKAMQSSNLCLIIISQVKDKIGVTFGRKEERSGGKSLDFFASQIVWLSHLARLKKTVNKVERATGVRVDVRCEKNKVGLPFRSFKFVIRFNYGIDNLQSNIEWLQEIGQLKQLKKGTKSSEVLSYADSLSDEDFKAFDKSVNEVVVTLWQSIEKDFLPTRRKYV